MNTASPRVDTLLPECQTVGVSSIFQTVSQNPLRSREEFKWHCEGLEKNISRKKCKLKVEKIESSGSAPLD